MKEVLEYKGASFFIVNLVFLQEIRNKYHVLTLLKMLFNRSININQLKSRRNKR